MARDDQNGGRRGQERPSSVPDRELTEALRTDQIEVHFLPTVELRTGRVVGAEALVRWARPGQGLLPPGQFLPDVSRIGLMRELTERVIELSTLPAGDWWRSGLSLELSVNLPSEMFDGADWQLDETISRALARAQLSARAVTFEITGEALTLESAAERLARLAALGASISLDDFAGGGSSAPVLSQLPIAELKIDRSLTRKLARDEVTPLRAAIGLAHQIGLRVVVEGVETEEAWHRLRGMGAERAQGFLISRPIPARQVPGWLAAWNQRARKLNSTRFARRPLHAAATGS